MKLTLTEIKIQVALGTFDLYNYRELEHIENKEVLTFFAFCSDVVLRRFAAVNRYTPFSVHQKQYNEDPDFLVKECAWEHVRSRYVRRYSKEPPTPLWRTTHFDLPTT